MERVAKWTRCHLSGELLSPPCVADELGHLFNKDAIVSGLDLHHSGPLCRLPMCTSAAMLLDGFLIFEPRCCTFNSHCEPDTRSCSRSTGGQSCAAAAGAHLQHQALD